MVSLMANLSLALGDSMMDSTPEIDRLLMLGWDLHREDDNGGSIWTWTDPLGNQYEQCRNHCNTPDLPPNVDRYLDPTTPLIGLSLSFCIREIAEGKVKISKVAKIIAGTCAANDADWDDVIARYRTTYWSNCPTECESALYWLKSEGLIEQPRLAGGNGPNISRGMWVIDQSHADYRMVRNEVW